MSVGWGCIDGVEVELWGECYNIEETTELDLLSLEYNSQYKIVPTQHSSVRIWSSK